MLIRRDRSQGEMLVRSMPTLFAFVRRRVGDLEATKEIIQEVSLRALAGAAPEDPRSFLPWSRGIACHVIYAEWRRRRRARSEQPPGNFSITGVRDPTPAPDTVLAARFSLAQAVGEEKDTVDLLWRRYVDETSSKQLAEELGLTAAALRMRLLRIRSSARTRAEPPDGGGPRTTVLPIIRWRRRRTTRT
jgi:DNA-directed RNA polymerase specialized sigma24 family protein